MGPKNQQAQILIYLAHIELLLNLGLDVFYSLFFIEFKSLFLIKILFYSCLSYISYCCCICCYCFFLILLIVHAIFKLINGAILPCKYLSENKKSNFILLLSIFNLFTLFNSSKYLFIN